MTKIHKNLNNKNKKFKDITKLLQRLDSKNLQKVKRMIAKKDVATKHINPKDKKTSKGPKNNWIPPVTESSRFYGLFTNILFTIYNTEHINHKVYYDIVAHIVGNYEHLVKHHGITEGTSR